MGRPRKTQPVAEIPPEEESQETTDSDFLTPEQSIAQAEQENFALNGAPSKAEAVRQAMADGLSKPGDIQEFVKARFGLDIPKPQISSYAAQARARQAKLEGGEVTARTRTASQPTQTFGIPAGFGADIKAVKQLIEKAGSSEDLSELVGDIAMLIGKYGERGVQDLIEAFA